MDLLGLKPLLQTYSKYEKSKYLKANFSIQDCQRLFYTNY